MKQIVKRLMYAVAPRRATAFFSERARSHSHRLIESWGGRRVNDVLFDRLGDRVLVGPFRGLALPPATRAEQVGPYLLGTYESDLLPAWEVILRGRYGQILDVGAKFGFYAVGLARHFPEARVIAFDTDRWARRVQAEVARANGVTGLEIRRYCSPGWLDRHLDPGAFLLSDCEGFEGELLASGPIRNLATAALIVETHDDFVPGVSARVRDRLAPTHALFEVRSGDHPHPLPADLDFLDPGERALASKEVRGEHNAWFVALPNSGPNASLRDLWPATA